MSFRRATGHASNRNGISPEHHTQRSSASFDLTRRGVEHTLAVRRGGSVHPARSVAIIEPTVAGLAAAVLVGWLLLFSGVAHVVGAFFLERHGWSRLWTVLLGVLYVIGGAYFVTHPLMGLGTLTLLLAAILIMEAVVRLMIYMRLRREGASGWLVVNAVITLLLGVMIWSRGPPAPSGRSA